MLASITPLGQRGRHGSWTRMTTFYVVASAVGGALWGAALGAVGAALPDPGARPTLTAGAAAAVVAVAVDLSGRTPSVRRQVDETWLSRYRDWVCGAGFGFQLGLGAVTIATSASLYLLWFLELLGASPTLAGLMGLLFGLARGLPVVANSGVRDAATLRRSHRRWQRAGRLARPLTIATEAAIGLALLVVVTT